MGRGHRYREGFATLAVLALISPSVMASEDEPAAPADVPPEAQPGEPDAPEGAPEAAPEAAAPGELVPIEETSLEDLLNFETTVATGKGRTLRDSPSIVTIVTREEIVASGARDLVDVLLLVPGFQIATDVDGVLGIGIRGLWAHEGKVLVLLDGHELNERLYTNFALANHIPVDHIARIEIIRGPGSANYGGFAELGVINIVTRGAELAGGAAGITVGRMGDKKSWRRIMSAAGGGQVAGADVSVSVTAGNSVQSDGTFSTFYGETYRFNPATAAADPMLINLQVRAGGLRLRYLYDGYHTTNRSAYGDELAPVPIPADFKGHYLDVAYELPLLDGDLVITPHASFKSVKPWFSTLDLDVDQYPSASGTHLDVTTRRWLGGVTASYDILENYAGEHDLNVQAGVEGVFDEAQVEQPGPINFGFGPDSSPYVSYANAALFAQALWQNPWVDVTAGARFEYHSFYKESFVPRIGLTRVFGDFHAKALFGQGFRSPGIQQIDAGILGNPFENPDAPEGLKAEKSTVFEGELGYHPFDFLFLSVNYYEMWIDNPIIYTYVADIDREFYYNERITGTRGIESDVRLRLPYLDINATYSFYMVSENTVGAYKVVDDSRLLVAMPAHKATLSATLKPGALWAPLQGLTFNVSGVGMSERVAFVGVDADGYSVQGREPALLLLNLYARYQPEALYGLGFGAGVFNLLDAPLRYPQAYDGYHPPVPGPSREWLVRVDYRLGFD